MQRGVMKFIVKRCVTQAQQGSSDELTAVSSPVDTLEVKEQQSFPGATLAPAVVTWRLYFKLDKPTQIWQKMIFQVMQFMTAPNSNFLSF